jgi:hypothetical protein
MTDGGWGRVKSLQEKGRGPAPKESYFAGKFGEFLFFAVS